MATPATTPLTTPATQPPASTLGQSFGQQAGPLKGGDEKANADKAAKDGVAASAAAVKTTLQNQRISQEEGYENRIRMTHRRDPFGLHGLFNALTPFYRGWDTFSPPKDPDKLNADLKNKIADYVRKNPRAEQLYFYRSDGRDIDPAVTAAATKLVKALSTRSVKDGGFGNTRLSVAQDGMGPGEYPPWCNDPVSRLLKNGRDRTSANATNKAINKLANA